MTNPFLFYDDLDEIPYKPPPQIYGATLSCDTVGVFKELHGIGVFHSTFPSANAAAFCITFVAIFLFWEFFFTILYLYALCTIYAQAVGRLLVLLQTLICMYMLCRGE